MATLPKACWAAWAPATGILEGIMGGGSPPGPGLPGGGGAWPGAGLPGTEGAGRPDGVGGGGLDCCGGAAPELPQLLLGGGGSRRVLAGDVLGW